jgi:hypothetical protein
MGSLLFNKHYSKLRGLWVQFMRSNVFSWYMIVKAISHAFLVLGYSQNLCTNVLGVIRTQEAQSTTMFWLVFTFHALTVQAWCHNTQRELAFHLDVHPSQLDVWWEFLSPHVKYITYKLTPCLQHLSPLFCYVLYHLLFSVPLLKPRGLKF